ncbi:aquaporin [Shigella boydii]
MPAWRWHWYDHSDDGLLYGHISGGHFNPAVTIGLWAGDVFRQKNHRYVMPRLSAVLCSGVLYLNASGKTGFNAAASGFALTVMASIHQAVIPCFPRW